MDIVVIDLETYYDKDYSLSKITTEAYVRDPRFEVIGVAVKVNDHPTDWYSGNDPGKFLRSLDYRDKAILAHNTMFDGAILSWHFGIKPKLWLDTLSMARPLHNIAVGGSLKNLTAYYGLGEKGDEVLNAIGKRRLDFTTSELQRYASYCRNDVELTYKLFKRMARGFPPSEIAIIDQTLRMYTEPMLVLDRAVLNTHLTNEVNRKEALLNSLGNANDFFSVGLTRDTLMSNEKLATYLTVLGIDPPTKTSPTTGKKTWAFSKSDKGFTKLLEHEEPFVSTVVAARLGVKSTIEESRTRSLLGVSERGPLPIMLNYYGAHTGRFSGGDKMNLQNLPRGGALRKSICAPPGKMLVACDSSQIEARVLAWVAGQNDIVQAFAEGRDIYSEFASVVYGRKITKADKLERFVGKTCIAEGTLVLSYQGWKPIESVTINDLLWDGEEWVCHQGLLNNGTKPTLNLCGAWLTPDHHVWSGTQWLEAQSVVADASILYQALDTGAENLPLQATWLAHVMEYPHSSFDATVAHLNTWLTTLASRTSEALAALCALKLQHLQSGIGCIVKRWQMINIELAYLTALLRQLLVATQRQVSTIGTMGSAGFAYALSGGKIAPRSYDTFKPSTGGTDPISRWTGSTWMGTTNRVTSASYHAAITSATNAKSQTLKRVFDILNCGSRNRFTILTDAGPVIVHNCILGLGYGMGSIKFRDTLALGMGGIKVDLEEHEAQRIVGLYRDRNQRIVALWNRCNAVIAGIINGDDMNISHALPSLVTSAEGIKLPNGFFIRYPMLTQYESGYAYAGDARVYREAVKNKVIGKGPPTEKFIRIYGGKVVENIVQALARIVVAEQMARIGSRYKVVLQVHDEVVILCDEAEVEEAKAYMIQVMSTPPSWAPDLPVACEADHGPNYGECK